MQSVQPRRGGGPGAENLFGGTGETVSERRGRNSERETLSARSDSRSSECFRGLLSEADGCEAAGSSQSEAEFESGGDVRSASAASTSMAMQAATCQRSASWVASKPAGEPVSSAIRQTNRRANSGRRRALSISRASSIRASARRRCCSERCRLRATSSDDCGLIREGARAANVFLRDIPLHRGDRARRTSPARCPRSAQQWNGQELTQVDIWLPTSRLVPGVRLASSVQKTSLARNACGGDAFGENVIHAARLRRGPRHSGRGTRSLPAAR